MIVCPHCRRPSLDERFCEHCDAALADDAPAGPPVSFTLPDGQTLDLSAFGGLWPVDCFRPLHVLAPARPRRVHALDRPWWRDLRSAVERRASLALPILPAISTHSVSGGELIVADGLPGARSPLLAEPPASEIERVERTLEACRLLGSAMTALHDAGLVWLNFDPDAIEAVGDRIQITNLDLCVYPFATCPDVVRLSPIYSPPEVCGLMSKEIGPVTDVFHLAAYAYYRLAELLPNGFPGEGLESFDFEFPHPRIYYPSLLPGIAPVLFHALARNPHDRFPTTGHFLAEWSAALDRERRRLSRSSSFRWDCAGSTAIGRGHVVVGMPNQDSLTMLSLDRQRSLYLVADGVTTCSIGAGEIASGIAVEVLAAELPALLLPQATAEQIEAALIEGCARASEAILERSREIGLPADVDPCDLMSTTILIAYAHGEVLSLASLGDSRVYLLSGQQAEQLTVDGDVRCVHLGAGAAPEQVRALGPDGSALFSCLGVSQRGPDGDLMRCPIRTRPRVTHWPMRFNDLVVLATDGLVEEGIFLDPDDLIRIVAESRLLERELLGTSAPPEMSELANAFVAAACAKHRGASAWEPFGLGDDVTCIVLRAHR